MDPVSDFFLNFAWSSSWATVWISIIFLCRAFGGKGVEEVQIWSLGVCLLVSTGLLWVAFVRPIGLAVVFCGPVLIAGALGVAAFKPVKGEVLRSWQVVLLAVCSVVLSAGLGIINSGIYLAIGLAGSF